MSGERGNAGPDKAILRDLLMGSHADHVRAAAKAALSSTFDLEVWAGLTWFAAARELDDDAVVRARSLACSTRQDVLQDVGFDYLTAVRATDAETVEYLETRLGSGDPGTTRCALYCIVALGLDGRSVRRRATTLMLEGALGIDTVYLKRWRADSDVHSLVRERLGSAEGRERALGCALRLQLASSEFDAVARELLDARRGLGGGSAGLGIAAAYFAKLRRAPDVDARFLLAAEGRSDDLSRADGFAYLAYQERSDEYAVRACEVAFEQASDPREAQSAIQWAIECAENSEPVRQAFRDRLSHPLLEWRRRAMSWLFFAGDDSPTTRDAAREILLHERDPLLRYSVLSYLAENRIHDELVAHVVRQLLLDSRGAERLVRTAGAYICRMRLADGETRRAVRTALGHPTPTHRSTALRCLSAIGAPEEAMQAAAAALEDHDAGVRATGLHCLTTTHAPPRPHPRLFKAFRTCWAEASSEVVEFFGRLALHDHQVFEWLVDQSGRAGSLTFDALDEFPARTALRADSAVPEGDY